ncbi:hypothetical protein BDY21DRAFT_125239 [Lineolata rhizophorae]|uniref:Uncharacterized protein n=1 Tax=Lineolata rhizophorae TaxID=578093 RepID=A0A6A6NNZ0_9PEZI|nr:hypothetical protein BDY21DRAFT_125239 [Lineolata rhizophorae]
MCFLGALGVLQQFMQLRGSITIGGWWVESTAVAPRVARAGCRESTKGEGPGGNRSKRTLEGEGMARTGSGRLTTLTSRTRGGGKARAGVLLFGRRDAEKEPGRRQSGGPNEKSLRRLCCKRSGHGRSKRQRRGKACLTCLCATLALCDFPRLPARLLGAIPPFHSARPSATPSLLAWRATEYIRLPFHSDGNRRRSQYRACVPEKPDSPLRPRSEADGACTSRPQAPGPRHPEHASRRVRPANHNRPAGRSFSFQQHEPLRTCLTPRARTKEVCLRLPQPSRLQPRAFRSDSAERKSQRAFQTGCSQTHAAFCFGHRRPPLSRAFAPTHSSRTALHPAPHLPRAPR